MKSVTPPDRPTFHTLQRPLLQRGLLQKVTVIAHAIKGKILAVTKESKRADRVIIETHMTCVTNRSSLGIYTLEDG